MSVRPIVERLPANFPCPCGSGDKYKDCSCYSKDFEYIIDPDGGISKILRLRGAEPGRDFFPIDVLPIQKDMFARQYLSAEKNHIIPAVDSVGVGAQTVKVLLDAGVHADVIAAFESTGLYFTEKARNLFSQREISSWQKAIDRSSAETL